METTTALARFDPHATRFALAVARSAYWPLLPGQWHAIALQAERAQLAAISDHPAAMVGTDTPNLDRELVLRALARSAISNWLVTVNVPLAVADAPLKRSAIFWGLTAAAALLLTTILAFQLANRIAKPMVRAAESAEALAKEEPVVALSSSISEANAIVAALQNASTELRERLTQQRLLARELNHRVKNLLAMVQAMVRRMLSSERPVAEARELIGQRLRALARAQDLLLRDRLEGCVN